MLLMLIAELHAVVDTTLVPIELSQTMQGLHMLEMLGYDDDGADEVGVNDIDIHQNSPNLVTTVTACLHALIADHSMWQLGTQRNM